MFCQTATSNHYFFFFFITSMPLLGVDSAEEKLFKCEKKPMHNFVNGIVNNFLLLLFYM